MNSNKILDHYGNINAGFLHSFGETSTEILIQRIDPKPHENILEIGCGTGATLVKIASRFNAANFFGTDRSAMMLAKASSRFRFCFLKKKIHLFSASDTLKTKMDKIYIESVLGIQEDEELKIMIEKIYDQLNAKGRLIINETIWKDDLEVEEINRINKACKQAFGIIQSNGKYHTKAMWAELFKQCGFNVISIEEINIKGVAKKRANVREILSVAYSWLGKLKGKFSGAYRSEMNMFQKSMKEIISHNKQIMTGVIFVLEKN